MAIRKIKAHKKSRRGCGNCKLRKIKCDETHPKCSKCVTYGVSCNYQSDIADLEVAFSKPQSDVLISIPSSPLTPLPVLYANDMPSYQMQASDMTLLTNYQEKTIYTMSNDRNRHLFQSDIAFPNTFVMHALLCISSMHDRFISGYTNLFTSTETFHLYRASVLFNKKLSGLLEPTDRDGLFAGSSMLGMLSFCHFEAESADEAWPLRSASPIDLNWLKLGDGKRAVWKLIEGLSPNKTESCIPILVIPSPPKYADTTTFDSLSSEFVGFYGLNATSTVENNPYHAAAYSLAQTLKISEQIPRVIGFMTFIGGLPSQYKQLLEEKDSRALLLFAYWYAMLAQIPLWWTLARSTIECQAICLYLERYHQHEPGIQRLVKYPRSVVFGEGAGHVRDLARKRSVNPGGKWIELRPT